MTMLTKAPGRCLNKISKKTVQQWEWIKLWSAYAENLFLHQGRYDAIFFLYDVR